MKNQTRLLKLVAFVILTITNLHSYAQDPWYSHGNIADSSYFIGTRNNKPLIVKTDSIDRIIVGTDSTQFLGLCVFDSLKIPNGYLKVDSIRVRVIHVGDSSLWIGSTSVGTTNDIATTTAASINFIRSSGTFSDFPGVNIGTQNYSYLLHIHDAGGSNNGAYTHYTNSTTGENLSDGFLVGVSSAGEAELLQRETLPMNFFTDNTFRMIIEAGGNVGINAATPANMLELTSNNFSPYWPDAAGLRLSNLTSGTTINMPNNASNTVLSVDANGDVVLVNDQIGPGGGVSYCSSPSTLTANAGYLLGGFSFYFDGTNAGEDIGIGYACSSVLTAKLDVFEGNNQYCIKGFNKSNLGGAEAISGTVSNSSGQIAIHGIASAQDIQIALQGDVSGASSNQTAAQLNADDLGNSSVQNFGVDSRVTSSGDGTLNWAVNGHCVSTGSFTSNVAGQFASNDNGKATSNFGVLSRALTSNGSAINTGVYARANNTSTGTITNNIGLYAVASPSNSAGGNYAAYFNGDIGGVGTFAYTSDSTLKENIVDVTNADSIISLLHPKYFEFNHSIHPQMNLPYGNQCGLIAQEVAQIAPDAVVQERFPAETDSAGNIIGASFPYLALNYNYLFTLLIAGHQRQNAKIDSLMQVINDCCNNGGNGGGERKAKNTGTANQTDVVLSDLNAVILRQNVPNPFAEQTVIGYVIPENAGFAQIIFYDQIGRILKTVDITTKGEGQLNVFAPDLSSGIYNYTLVVDGKIVDHKNMVKMK